MRHSCPHLAQRTWKRRRARTPHSMSPRNARLTLSGRAPRLVLCRGGTWPTVRIGLWLQLAQHRSLDSWFACDRCGSVLLKNSKFRTLRFLAQGQFNRASTLPVEHRAICKRLAAFKHDQRTPRCPRRSNHPTGRELFDRDRKRRCSTESIAGCLSSQHAAVVRHAPARSRRSPPW